MTQTKCDILVFIGRFQPFHIGHKAVLDAALAQAEKVIVLAGSAVTTSALEFHFVVMDAG